MRPIRFRAWDKEKKQMIESVAAIHFDYKYIGVYEYGQFGEEMHSDGNYDIELMQYTGLRDKNGKEIYEGDIVKFQMTRKKLVDHQVMTAFEDETAIYQGAVRWGKFGWRPFIDGRVEECEVIGNVWENPELV